MEKLIKNPPKITKPFARLLQESDAPVFEFAESASEAAHCLVADGAAYADFAQFVRPKFDEFFLTIPCKSRVYHLRHVEDSFLLVCENKHGRRYALSFRSCAEQGLRMQTLGVPQDSEGVFMAEPSDGVTEAIVVEVTCLLILLNMPKLSESEFLPANARVNEKREKQGKRKLSDKTIVRPHPSKAQYFEYVRDCKANDDTVPEKWWGGYWNFYWEKVDENQPPHGPLMPVEHWIEGKAPAHKRAQYIVKHGGKKKVDPVERVKQLALRRQVKDLAS